MRLNRDADIITSGERKMKQKSYQGGYPSPMMQFNRELENQLQPLHSVVRVGTPFCRYNDELVGRIEFEIISRNDIRLKHNASSAVHYIDSRPESR